jgi:uncharacterized protein
MGAEEDVATVRRGYEAFNTGDMETLLGLFDENASWHIPGRSSMAGDHEGRDATFAYFGQLGAQTEGSFRATLDQLTAGDGRVVGIHHNTGERNGKQLDVECCLVFQLKDGKIVDGREHYEDLYAWDDFWS